VRADAAYVWRVDPEKVDFSPALYTYLALFHRMATPLYNHIALLSAIGYDM